MRVRSLSKSRINSYIDLNGEIKNIDGYNAALARAEKILMKI